jgi:MFS family permease
MPTGYTILADAIVLIHATYVAFVIGGLLAILLGAALGWRWTRSFAFRVTHLAAIALVCLESIVGVICPLTSLEYSMRNRAGATRYPGDFVAYWAHRMIFYNFPPWIFTTAYISFAILVAITFIAIPPRRPSRTTHSF